MRILVVTSIFPCNRWDPHGSFVLDQSLALTERGHEVEVVVLERAGGPARRDAWGLAGVRSIRYVPTPLRLGAGAWSRSVRSQLRSLRSVLAGGVDVALVHDELVAAAVEPALTEVAIPWALVVHGENRNPALLRASGSRVKNDVYGRASAIVTVGEGVDVPLWASDKERRIPNGAAVPSADGDPPSRTAPVMAVSVSGLRDGKGIQDNLEALARLVADGVDVGYWVAGDGPLRKELEQLAARLGVGDRVRFLGSVRRDRLGAVLDVSDFFTLPSSPEAFGIAYVEAMQAGKPVIACRGEGPAAFTIDGENGFLVPPGDVPELGRVMRILCTDGELRRRMGEFARRTGARYTWATNAEAVERVLGEIAEHRLPRSAGRHLWWLGMEPTAYMLDGARAVRSLIPDTRVAFLEGGGDVSPAQLLTAIARRRAAVVLVEGWGHPSMLLAMWLAFLFRVPYIVGSDTHHSTPGRSGLVRRIVRRFAIGPLLRRATVLFPGGTPQARYVRQVVGPGAPPTMIAHMTVDTDAFEQVAARTEPEERAEMRARWGFDDRDTVVLFVGRLDEEKGLAVLMQALDQVGDPRVGIVVYGAGPLEAHLREAASRSRIHLAGTANKETLALAYVSADIFVLPSRFEPWGLVVNEAMASGLPCVVSDAVGSAEDLITQDETGWVTPSGDPGALAEILRTLAADPVLRRKAGAAAQERMRDWSMDRFASSVLQAVNAAEGRPR